MQSAAQTNSESKRISFSVMIEQNITLNDWHKEDMYNKYLPDLTTSEILFRVDFTIYKSAGLWVQYGGGFRKKGERIPFEFNMFDDINMSNLYQQEASKVDGYDDGISTNSDRASPSFAAGIFNKYYLNKWILTPYLGVGFNEINGYKLSYTLKEIGTNTAYDVNYNWFGNHKSKTKYMSYLYAQFKTEYKISSKINLALGINYRFYLPRSVFKVSLRNHYDGSLIKEFEVKGRHINTLGLSAGITF